LVGVFVIGAPMGIVMLYQSMSLVATQFSHANIKLPKSVDKAISYILISPDMHKIHHHYVLPYTDSNYGNIFSIWDRLLGTYMYMERENLVYGVDVFPDEEKNGQLVELLKQPFQPYQKPTILPDED
jgi:sterol desaturase/sphingolipid hydroxylase (fatty acid hydroxylase superfamily)